MALKVAVVGAGNGGFATSSQLALQGFEVHLFELPAFAASIEELQKNPVITSAGALLTGEGRLAGVHAGADPVIAECELILITAQTPGHVPAAEMIAPYIHGDQVIVIMPGNCSSILVRQALDKVGAKGIVGECLTLPYACRKTDNHSIRISRSTGRMGLATFPSIHTEKALEVFKKVYPTAFAMDNVLEVALCNANILLHPIPTLLSLSRIEFSNGEFYVYNEAYTPSVEKAIAALDKEIASILRALDFPAPSCKVLFEKRYEGTWDEKRTWFRKIGSKGPFKSTDRYISEDVPGGVVLVASLGKQLGIPTPIADAVIALTSAINGTDYMATGRNTQSLGLAGLSRDELKRTLREGFAA